MPVHLIGASSNHPRVSKRDPGMLGSRKDEYDDKSILVIGPPSSGKSTIIRRLKFCLEGLASISLPEYKAQIYANVLEATERLVAYLDAKDVPMSQEIVLARSFKTALNKFRSNADHDMSQLSVELSQAIYDVFNHTTAKNAISHGLVEGITYPESAVYLLDNAIRICHTNYIPIQGDILRTWRTDDSPTITSTLIGTPGQRIHAIEARVADNADSILTSVMEGPTPDLVLLCVPIDRCENTESLEHFLDLWCTIIADLGANDRKSIGLVFNRVDVFAGKLYMFSSGPNVPDSCGAARAIAEIFKARSGSSIPFPVFFSDATTFMADSAILRLLE